MSVSLLRLFYWSSQVVLVVKNPPANAGIIRNAGSIPGLGISLGGEHGNSLQYSCLENSLDKVAGRLQSMGLQRVRHNWSYLAHSTTYNGHFITSQDFVLQFTFSNYEAELMFWIVPSIGEHKLKNDIPRKKMIKLCTIRESNFTIISKALIYMLNIHKYNLIYISRKSLQLMDNVMQRNWKS